MLLIKENDINPEVKQVLNKILTQLSEISSVTKKDIFKDDEDIKKIDIFCNQILQNKNPTIFLETFFSNTDSWGKTANLEKLASLLSLDTKEIAIIENEYSVKYPKKLNVTKKDSALLHEVIDFSLVEDVKALPSLKLLNKVKSLYCSTNLANHLVKSVKNSEGGSFNQFVKKLQSKLLNNPKVSPEYFAKYFGIAPIDTNFAEIEKVSGIAIFSSVLRKDRSEQSIFQMKDISKLEQISIKDVIDMGVTFNLDSAKNYHFFRNGDDVYPLYKDNPIIDAKVDDLVSNPVVAKREYREVKIDLDIWFDKLEEISGKKVLNYDSFKKIRTAILLQRPKWSTGSVLKQDNCYFYVMSNLKPQKSGDFFLEAVVINPEYQSEYFIRNDIRIDKSNVDKFQLADKLDSLLVLEAINSAFQYLETRKSNYEIDQTMRKRMGY